VVSARNVDNTVAARPRWRPRPNDDPEARREPARRRVVALAVPEGPTR